MLKKTINILMTTFNGERYIEEQIESIINQTAENWKLFIRDDGSTDSTVGIIKKFVDQNPGKINYIESAKKHLGAKDNFAILLDSTNGNYFMFCDQDDVWLPDKIELTFERMLEVEGKNGNETPILIHTDLKVVDENLHILAESFSKYQNLKPRKVKSINRLIVQNVITGCTVMINRALKDIALPFPDSAIMHDWWLGLVASAFGIVDYIDIPTVLYRQHDINEIGAKKWSFRYIFDSAQSLKDKAVSIKMTIDQAKSFIKKYGKTLDKKSLDIANAYSHLDECSFFEKRFKIIKYNFYKIGILRNIGMLIRV